MATSAGVPLVVRGSAHSVAGQSSNDGGIVVCNRPGPGDPVRRRFALEASGGVSGSMKVGVGLYSMVPPQKPAALAAVRSAHRACLELCADLEGRPYLYGWHELDDGLRQRFYGSSLASLAALKARVDPGGILPSPLLAPP